MISILVHLKKDGNDEVEEEVRELSDIIDDDGINLNYNYDYFGYFGCHLNNRLFDHY